MLLLVSLPSPGSNSVLLPSSYFLILVEDLPGNRSSSPIFVVSPHPRRRFPGEPTVDHSLGVHSPYPYIKASPLTKYMAKFPRVHSLSRLWNHLSNPNASGNYVSPRSAVMSEVFRLLHSGRQEFTQKFIFHRGESLLLISSWTWDQAMVEFPLPVFWFFLFFSFFSFFPF